METWINTLNDWILHYTGLSHVAQFKLFKTALLLLVTVALLRGVGRLIHWRIKDQTRQYLARKAAGYLIGFFALLILWRIWLGGGLAAYIGIFSAGVAIALKDPLANLAGWAFITVRKPFNVGDRIDINGTAGDVIDLRLFSFSLMEIGQWVAADQSTGRIVHVPNGWLFLYAVYNFTQGFNFIWNEIPVLVTFESDWRHAKQILAEIAARHTAIKSEHAARQVQHAARKFLIHFQHLTPIVWTEVRDCGVLLTIRYLCEPRRRRSSAEGIWEEILDAFAKENTIDFAYPTQRFYDNALEGKSGARAQPLKEQPLKEQHP